MSHRIQLTAAPLVIMTAWLVMHGSVGRAEHRVFASASPTLAENKADAPPLPVVIPCVWEDPRKLGVMLFCTCLGAYVGLMMKLENDLAFAKDAKIKRRTAYALVSIAYGTCVTPYLLMWLALNPPLNLCAAVGFGNAFVAWLALEVLYTRARKIVVAVADKVLPKTDDGGKP